MLRRRLSHDINGALKARPYAGFFSVRRFFLESFDMPQPLSRVKPGATVRQRPRVLDYLPPKYAQLVAGIFSNWSLIEYRLSTLLVRILGADAEPALAMYATLDAQHLKLGAIEAAAKAALEENEYDIFKATMSMTRSVQTPRNQLAHWIWAHSSELPDALLVAEPKSAKDRDREFTLALESGETDSAKISALNTFDPAHVQVYREGDLQRARDDMEQGAEITYLTIVYLDGLYKGRIKPLPWTSRTPTRAQLFEQLYGQRLFQEAWDRIQTDRKKSQQSST
jgi:hypothetical protein